MATARRGTISRAKTTPRRSSPADRAADVVAEIDFGEVGVAGDGEAEEADVFEAEADDADVGLAVVEVGFGAGGREALDDVGGDGEVEEEQVAPGGG